MLYDYTSLLTPLLKEGGRLMLEAKRIESEDNLKEKGDPANLVTVYDVAVQRLLINGITAKLPGATFIAEEKDNTPESAEAEHCFVIDPIDGTANFTRGFNHSCISVGVISRGVTVYGAVYDPYLDEMFTAELGGGTRVNGIPVRPSEHDAAHSVIIFGTSPYYKQTLGKRTFAVVEELYGSCADLRRTGTAALDLAYIAAGRADGFIELILSPWDFVAGSLLVREAGGVITDLEGNVPKGTSPSPIIAGTTKIHKLILDTARRN